MPRPSGILLAEVACTVIPAVPSKFLRVNWYLPGGSGLIEARDVVDATVAIRASV